MSVSTTSGSDDDAMWDDHRKLSVKPMFSEYSRRGNIIYDRSV